MRVLYKPPKFVLAVFLRYTFVIFDILGFEPFFFEFVAFLLKRVQGILATVFEAIVFSSSRQAFHTVPLGAWDTGQGRIKAVHVVTSIASIAK
jgi:hypothetical protein